MAVPFAYIVDERFFKLFDAHGPAFETVEPRDTPFGKSEPIYLARRDKPYLLLCPGGSPRRLAPHKIPMRANFYTLKDMGVRRIVGCARAHSIKHDVAVGDLVIPNDLIDMTYLRTKSFFEDRPLEYLRQFPVFCPALREVLTEKLEQSAARRHVQAVAAICDGMRLRTPAEVRMLAGNGAQIITHECIPEAFLAKELQLCYAAVCYVARFADTGSRHQPLARGLFAGQSEPSDDQKVHSSLERLKQLIEQIADLAGAHPGQCECDKTMAENIRRYDMPEDWHAWFR